MFVCKLSVLTSGLLTKASYSSTSYDASRSVSKKNLLEDTFSYKINGTNHTRLYFRDKWLLDSSDDEYGGVLVNADRLPSDRDKFTFVLRASLSHWKVKVLHFQQLLYYTSLKFQDSISCLVLINTRVRDTTFLVIL